MTTPANARPRTLLWVLYATTLVGATSQAAFLATDAFPVSPLLSIVMMLACTGKLAGATFMVRRRKIGWWIWVGSGLAFPLLWYAAAHKEMSNVREQLETMPEAQRMLNEGISHTPLGNSPVLGLVALLALYVVWGLLYRSQRRHFPD